MLHPLSRTVRRTASLIVAVTLIASLAAVGWTPVPAGATASVMIDGAERDFLNLLNATRQGQGLEALGLSRGLSNQARSWSGAMASSNQLSHDGNLAAETAAVVPDWRRAGENVGVGYSVSNLHQAFWESAGHRANMLGSFNQVGIGVTVEGSGRIWVTFRFALGTLSDAMAPAADTTPPTAVINPAVPATSSSARISVGWWGQDSDSHIRSFDVDVADNGGPWITWFKDAAPKYVVGSDASGLFNFYGRAGHSYRFRVRSHDGAGNTAPWSESTPVAVSSGAPAAEPFAQLHAVSRSGDLASISSTPMNAPQWPGDVVRGFVARAGGGGYVLDDFGGVYAVGDAPPLSNSSYWPGWDIARGLALNPDGAGGYVLDGWGGLHPFGNAQPVAGSGYWPGWDIARGIALLPSSTAAAPAGYVMDAWGGLHPFGSAPPVADAPYWVGWAMARSVVTNQTGPGGWTLDGWGGVHAWGGAPQLQPTAYWFGHDVARGLAVFDTPQGIAGYVLDWWGGVHRLGAAPTVESTRYWAGTDAARFLAVSP